VSKTGKNSARAPAQASLETGDGGALVLRLSGEWHIAAGFPDAEKTARPLATANANATAATATPAATPPAVADAAPPARQLNFDCSALGAHDSSLPAYLLALHRHCEPHGITFDTASLPPDIARLLAIGAARAKDVEVDAANLGAPRTGQYPILRRLGEWALRSAEAWRKTFEFCGEVSIAFFNFFRGRARVRARECWALIQSGGVEALPIVSLISFLTGLILTYFGMLQMRQVGAVSYVPGVVGLTVLREMGVLMTGVILCGRTATAYASQLASMQVSEEIPALRVLGISPIEYLVLPRIIALFFMMPLLTLYSNFCGILASILICSTMDLSFTQTVEMMTSWFATYGFFTSLASGLIKSACFAVLIAGAGCFRGINSGKSSQAVGDATTSAAVLSITLLVIADAVFSVLFNAINFYHR
jgi:phospholipid/cholesterol/gamma-HCH transport system permease protein